MNGLSTTHAVALVETSYTGTVDAIEPQSSTGDEDVVITGRAVERSTGDPLSGVPLKLVVTHDGFERNFEVYTGDDGFFTHAYTPADGESGIFQVRAVHPDLTDKPVHGQFTINRISVNPTTGNLNIPRNYEQTITVTVTAGVGTDVNDMQLVFDPADQAGGELPAGIHLTTGIPLPSLTGGNSAKLSFTVWADNNASATETLVLRVASTENDHWCDLTINAGFSDAQPVLFFTPDHVETGMAINDTVTETVTLSNKGLASMTGVNLSLLSADGSVAPDWAVLNGDCDLGDLAVGESVKASVTFAPGDGVAEGIYHLVLRVISDNYAQTDINLYASVTQSGIGNVLFKISDIYTGTLDENLQVIQGLEGANITLQNELVTTQTYTGTSDAAGEALFQDLPSGRYKARITAANHQEYIGRLWIKPGITTTEDIFLEYNLVTVEW
jgi:large repetitive protein